MRLKRFDTINVVPFIDIMLVILVIILTTASFIQLGVIKLNLPTANGENINEINRTKELNISIKREGEIFFNKIKVPKQKIENKILEYNRSVNIALYCDRDVKFSEFVFLLDILKSNGYENLGIITKKDEK